MNKTYMLVHKRIVESHADGENIYSTMLLGFFSSKIKSKEAIQFYLNLPGYKDYPNDFKIKAVYADVDDFSSVVGNFNESVFHLSHEYSDGEYDYISDLGFYSSNEKAVAAMVRYKTKGCYIKYPQGFSIDEYRINDMEWTEGFFTY